VPALWTPVDDAVMPEAARRIQMNHGDLGAEYAQEGFYTLIKNSVYRDQYTTAVEQLARHIIRAAAVRLRPCDVRDFGQPRNAFDMSGRRAPADRRLNIIIVAATVDRLPAGRSRDFYGSSSRDWNPFHPLAGSPLPTTPPLSPACPVTSRPCSVGRRGARSSTRATRPRAWACS
jgi:hypothetical protein